MFACLGCWVIRLTLNLDTALCHNHTEMAIQKDHERFLAEARQLMGE